ncbi:MAG: hypothetical protein JW818_15715 [Pirellulales bacterium]|nr:hypothetical protein [Pirellulales bacterium]
MALEDPKLDYSKGCFGVLNVTPTEEGATMPIKIQCPGCGRVRSAPDEWAGKRAKCNVCGAMMAIPAAVPNGPTTPSPAPIPMAILAPTPSASQLPSVATAAADAGSPTLLDSSFPPPDPGVYPEVSTLSPLPRKKRAKAFKGGFGARKRGLAIMGVAAAACLLLVYVVWLAISSFLANSSMPDWTACACPEGATMIASANVERLYKSKLAKALLDKFPNEAPFKDETGTTLGLEDVILIVMAESKEGKFAMIQTKKDMSFDDIFDKPPKDADVKSQGDAKYFKFDHNGKSVYYAKVGPCRYIGGEVQEERAFTDALDRVATGKKTKLGESLQAVLDKVGGADLVMATTQRPGTSRQRPGMSRQIPGMGGLGNSDSVKAIGMGFSVGSSLSIRGCGIFHEKGDAKRCYEGFKDQMEEMRNAADKIARSDMIPSSDKKKIQRAIDVMNRLKVSQSGDTVFVSGSWDVDDLIEMMDQIPTSATRGFF